MANKNNLIRLIQADGFYYMALSHKDRELQIHEFDWLKRISTAV